MTLAEQNAERTDELEKIINVEKAYKAEMARMKPILETKQQQLEEKQKHEEIKRMALKFYEIMSITLDKNPDNGITICWTKNTLQMCWEAARAFYEFAKKKEQEQENETN